MSKLVVLQGQRLEDLHELVAAWWDANPLAGLDDERVVVASNGMAEWFKMRTAQALGICAATRVELPARFLWALVPRVLAHEDMPNPLPLQREDMVWRLMGLWETLEADPAMAPLIDWSRHCAASPDMGRLQACQAVADLFDGYQVYRPDWLEDWERGEDVLRQSPGRPPISLEPADLWQAKLWRALVDTLPEHQRRWHRAAWMARLVSALGQAQPGQLALPERLTLFGMSALPPVWLDILSGLSRHCQVLLAVPNPCRYHWADALDGRQWFAGLARQRRPDRPSGPDLSTIDLSLMHWHAHPLLVQWGRQSRDFLRALDAHDPSASANVQALPASHWASVDAYGNEAGDTALARVQAFVRDFVPVKEHGDWRPAPGDRSIVFHSAPGLVRELEVLQDHLLTVLAPTSQPPLAPHQVVVMVPDMDKAAPLIHAVMGQYGREDPRFIPYEIVDLGIRQRLPLMEGLDALLQVHRLRWTLVEWMAWLELPSVAARVDLDEAGVEVARQWLSGSGMRWGIDAQQRQDFGMPAMGDAASLDHSLQRMMAGYAAGRQDETVWGVAPYEEVAGLEAVVAARLMDLLQGVSAWRKVAMGQYTVPEWCAHWRQVLADFLAPCTEEDTLAVAQWESALRRTEQAARAAGFESVLPLDAMAKLWQSELDEDAAKTRFLGSGVTFCTLTPMRSIPFELVCLIGMNDGEFPRLDRRSDQDLLARPGMARPGDRWRREDDRQLMLESLLSARRQFYVSWSGRSVESFTEQPPSVLVSQWRDYLREIWGRDWLQACTTEHPLQVFSPSALRGSAGSPSWHREWAVFHEPRSDTLQPVDRPAVPHEDLRSHSPDELKNFLKSPAAHGFRRVLGVSLRKGQEEGLLEEEPFEIDGLDKWKIATELWDVWQAHALQAAAEGALHDSSSVMEAIARQLHTWQLQGRWPLSHPGRNLMKSQQQRWQDLVQGWHSQFEAPAVKQLSPWTLSLPLEPGELTWQGVAMPPWRWVGRDGQDVQLHWVPLGLGPEPSSAKRSDGKALSFKDIKLHRLMAGWVDAVIAAARGQGLTTVFLGPDGQLALPAPDPQEAMAQLSRWSQAMRQDVWPPWPVGPQTALAWLSSSEAACLAEEMGEEAALKAHEAARKAYEPSIWGGRTVPGEGERDPALKRLATTYEQLCDVGFDGRLAQSWWGTLVQAVRQAMQEATP